MIREKELLVFPEEKMVSNVIKYDEGDIFILQELYTDWMILNEKILKIGGRPSMLPAEFVEALVAYKMNYWRIDDAHLGFDCFDPEGKEWHNRIEIKYATSRIDFSIFSSRINWDRLNFVRFYNESPYYCYVEIYDISIDAILEESEKFGRSIYERRGLRPRINIFRELVERGIYQNKKEFSLF